MVDVFTKEKRSEIMSRIRSKDTKMELAAKGRLEKMGFTYHPKGIHGNPDFIHPLLKVAVFLDGCFWHGCQKHYRQPKSNGGFWRAKIERNMKRDRRVVRELRKEGWTVIRLWEHDVKQNPAAHHE